MVRLALPLRAMIRHDQFGCIGILSTTLWASVSFCSGFQAIELHQIAYIFNPTYSQELFTMFILTL